ncbi:serine-threonine kinase 19 protein [Rutstroemia sp. NJR-2017a BBW]|nr:serine-threonine kinase 19 protein [Rutstroemia sp. NJR-2017a BBW]
MSLYRSAALSSRIKKTKPASLRRSSSSPFASLPKRKPTQRSKSIPEPTEDEDEEDFLDERLDDIGLVRTLATDLTLRDVAQAIQYIRGKMWTKLPDQRSGMNSTRIAEVLNFRKFLPPIVTVSLKEEFLKLLRDHPTALKFPRSQLSEESAKAFVYAGFLTLSASHYTTTDHFSRPGDGSKGTLTSLNSISRAASGSLAAVGGEGALHAAGGSGGGARLAGHGDFSLSLPGTGQFLKLLSGARSHFASLLAKSKYRETPESLLRQRWDGGIEGNDVASAAKRSRGEFAGVLPGKTSKWKRHFGLSFEWVLEECVGAGLVEVFNTRSIGRGVRVL